MSDKLIKSGVIVSVMTLLSRVLGLIRDMVIAKFVGVGAESDVFFFANKIPNFLRRLFGEGAFAQAFVPVLSEYQARDEESNTNETRQLIAYVSGTLGIVVTVVTLIGVIASPLIVILFGFGWFLDWLQDTGDGSKFELASQMLKITFPYLWFISLTALSGAILNTLGKFAVAAFTPVLLNVCIIFTAIYVSPQLEQPAFGLAWGVFIGGLVQFLFQLPFLYRAKVLVKPQWGWNTDGVKKIRTLMLPALFGVSVTQINLLLDTLIASFLTTGSISWLYYSDRLLEFPLGLFGIGIATVILPRLSRLHASKNEHEFSSTLTWGMNVVTTLGWPAMAGLMVLAQPIIIVLFFGGQFDAQQVERVSYSLYAYLAGLLSFMMIKILAPGFYARHDTKTPVKIGIIAMVVNMMFNLAFAPFWGYVGLALATACSALVNAALLYFALNKAGVFKLTGKDIIFQCRLIVAALVMTLVLITVLPSAQQWYEMSIVTRILSLSGLIGLGGVSYLLTIILLGIRIKHFKVITTAD